MIIPNIDELKKYSIDELKNLCNDIREILINLSHNKAIHLSSNLGIVELSVALLYVFDSPEDKIVYDVGHQCYVHKILTNRNNLLHSIYTYKGLSGFQDPCESNHDLVSFGHSSTSLSFVQGVVENLPFLNYCIPVIGDASIANGLAFEALNNISYNQTKMIIILNDNGMSISKNVGGLANAYNDSLTKNFFNALNIDYLGPFDGNDIFQVVDVLKYVKNHSLTKPVLIHFKTVKGNGLDNAENDVDGIYHHTNLSPMVSKKNNLYGYVAAKHLSQLTKMDNSIRVFNAAMTLGSSFLEYSKKFVDNYEDVGICESHCVLKAVGAYWANKNVFVILYSTFLQRAFDQLCHDVSRNNAAITFLIDKADIAYAEGDTHHGIYDLAYLKSIPNFIITSPSSEFELKQLINLGYANKKNPFVIRYSKDQCFVRSKNIHFNFGDWVYLQKVKGSKTLIISYGQIINELYKVYENKNIDIVNAIFLTYYDLEQVKQILKSYQKIYVVEKVYFANNLYTDLVLIAYNNKIKTDIESICIKNSKVSFGQKEIIDKLLKIDINSITSKIVL